MQWCSGRMKSASRGARRQTKRRLGACCRPGAKLALAGVAIGLAGALAVARLMSSLLFGVAPKTPLTFAAVAGLLTAVALVRAKSGAAGDEGGPDGSAAIRMTPLNYFLPGALVFIFFLWAKIIDHRLAQDGGNAVFPRGGPMRMDIGRSCHTTFSIVNRQSARRGGR